MFSLRVKKKAKKKLSQPRRSWAIDPVTRVKQSDKTYSRDAAKKNVKKELDES
jgi:hypothetical protein